ncbi:ethanolamine utilization protein [Brevundimonas sp.]|jgi:ethanolamine utilization protein EutQ (cupin superfamily)|uniref:ethanolamine utilization protein n=1 Tax=Brevundimonas sp. TaxID=1871086 RepID=UPI003D0BCB19
MKVSKLRREDAVMERAPDQSGDIFNGDLVNDKDGGPITIGFGRYEPHQRLEITLKVHDVMIVQEGRLTVTFDDRTEEVVPGEIVYMPTGQTVVIQTGEERALTAYVTHPHWNTPE